MEFFNLFTIFQFLWYLQIINFGFQIQSRFGTSSPSPSPTLNQNPIENLNLNPKQNLKQTQIRNYSNLIQNQNLI